VTGTKKNIISIALSVIGTAIILFYSLCGGTCSYFKGAIFGIDLKYVGILYMLAFIVLNILKLELIILVSISIALGIEFYLIGFQVIYWTFCPFCLCFGGVIVTQFLLHADWSKRWHMFFFILIGLLFFLFFFKGSLLPVYDFTDMKNAIF
jgi:hypothetical protein